MPTGSMNSEENKEEKLQEPPAQNRRITSRSQINRGNRRGEDRNNQPQMRRPRLHELLGDVQPNFHVDEKLQDMLLQMADDFVDTTLTTACAFAKNQRVPTVQLRDIQLHLERYWDMWLPNLGNDEWPPAVIEAQKQPLTLITKNDKN